MISGRLGLLVVLVASAAASTQSPAQSNRTTGTATTYYVSVAGNDNAGTPNDPAKPYRSPRGAYAAIPADITSGPGDHVIQLTDGSVYGQLMMTSKVTDAAHRIILRASSGMAPIMDAYSVADGSAGRADNNPALRIQASHVVVEGLRFHNTSLDTTIARHQVMVRVDGSSVVIDNNYFDGNGRSPTPFDMFLLVCAGASDNVISGNRFDYSGGKGLIYVGAGCGGGSPGRQTIRNNALSRFGNNPQGICAAINFGGNSGSLAGNSSIVENNTVFDNGGACYGLLNTNGSALTVRNNIFSKITGARFAIGCSGINGSSSGIAYNSVMYGNTNNVETACAGGGRWALNTYYSEDPYFVDPGATPPDLHVQSTVGSRRNGTSTWHVDSHCSVAIDKAPASDTFDLEPLPNGSRRELGAYGNTSEASKTCRQTSVGDPMQAVANAALGLDGDFETTARVLTLYDRQGNAVRTVGELAVYSWPALSPDGKRLAVAKRDEPTRTSQIWVLEISTGLSTRITSDPAPVHTSPVWSPDGAQIAYASNPSGSFGLYRKAANGTGSAELLYQHPDRGILYIADWPSGGQFLSFFASPSGGLYFLPLNAGGGAPSKPGERKAIEIIPGQFRSRAGRFSPDSRFLSYLSNQSGEDEIWVRLFAPLASASATPTAGPWRISDAGGLGLVAWRQDGKEIYYLARDGGVMAVEISTTSGFTAGKPRLLFTAPDAFSLSQYPILGHSISRDGQQFLFAQRAR